MAERSIRSSFQSVTFFVISGLSIGLKKYKDDDVRVSTIEDENETSENKLQVPELSSLIHVFIEVLASIKEVDLDLDLWKNFAWKSEEEHSLLDLMGIAVCNVDLHGQEIHESLVPDREQVVAYVKAVTADKGENISLGEQFKIALSLSHNSPISAAFLAFVSSRMLARRMDNRFYDDKRITITDEMMIEFKKNTASFYNEINSFVENSEKIKKDDPDGKTEDPGDTYYFWTSCCMGITLRFLEDKKPIRSKLVVKPFYRFGVNLMMFARKIAGQPNYSSHRVPEQMGFDVGWALAEEALVRTKA